MTKVAVVLSGCGVFDGSEIHEAVSLLLHLSRASVEYACFAPDEMQTDVIDHLAGEPVEGEARNVLVESARIARGKIRPLSELDAAAFDAVFFPGGFGAAKNLCSFASDGAECTIHPDVERTLKAFVAAGKPIGMCCIAPVIAARVFGTVVGGKGVTVTVGQDPGTAAAIEAMGSRNSVKPVTDVEIDEAHNLVTTPAYMLDASIHEIHDGIGKMVQQALARIGSPAGAR